jgi:hypothetical protein
MCGCVLLVTTKLFGAGAGAGAVTAAVAAIPFTSLWFGMPLVRRRGLNDSTAGEAGQAGEP